MRYGKYHNCKNGYCDPVCIWDLDPSLVPEWARKAAEAEER